MDKKNKKIIFISSYPKSGNTWIRILISCLLNSNNGIFSLKDLEKIKLFSQKTYFLHFNNIKYQENGNLDFKFITDNWINAQKRINDRANNIRFFKTHSVRGIINGNYFTNEDVCLGFIYLIRDPRDVAVSFSRHMGITIDEAIEIMLFKNNYLTSVFQVNEPVCTWFNHLESWTNFKTVSRLIIKYEDIVNNTPIILNQIIEFLNKTGKMDINVKKDFLKNVLESTKFNRLQHLENTNGFKEASSHSKFFRKGELCQWKKVLKAAQLKLIEKELYKPMRMLNYL